MTKQSVLMVKEPERRTKKKKKYENENDGLNNYATNTNSKIPAHISENTVTGQITMNASVGNSSEAAVNRRKHSLPDIDDSDEKSEKRRKESTDDDGESVECIFCEVRMKKGVFKDHVIICSHDFFNVNFNDDFADGTQKISNKIRSQNFPKKLTSDNCRNDKKLTSDNCRNDKEVENVTNKIHFPGLQCPICNKKFTYKEYKSKYLHINACVKAADSKECIFCGLHVELESHMIHSSECFQNIFMGDFSDEGIASPALDIHQKNHIDIGSDNDKYNCPFCFDLFEEVEMDSHIKKCVEFADRMSQVDKKILLDSLMNAF